MDIIKQVKRVLSVNWFQSFRFNLHYFPITKAIRFPMLIGYGVHVDSMGDKGSITLNGGFGSLCYALKHDPFHMGYSKSYWNLETGATIEFTGTARFSKGTILNVFSGGQLWIGDKFTSNANLILSCAKSISIGEDALLGWNITIMDSDGGHKMRKLTTNEVSNSAKEIVIGDHVWISAEASILKGSKIPTGSIVGYKSNVCGLKSNTFNSIIAGNPASVVREGYVWEH